MVGKPITLESFAASVVAIRTALVGFLATLVRS